ncbi:lysophospholipid acyltransferase family protein [Planctomycetota bacterium]
MFKEKLKAKWFWVARGICQIFCISFFRVRSYGRDNIPKKGAFVLISNHQSYLDPILCGITSHRRLGFLARNTLFTHWFFGRLISSVGTMPVKMGEADLTAMRKVIAKLKKGEAICLFPEGTRSPDGRIERFKPGFGLLCRRGKAAIVPAVVDGAFECWPRHKKLFSRGPIWVCFGKPISAEQAKNMGDEKLADVLTDTLRQMQTKIRIQHGKEPYDY